MRLVCATRIACGGKQAVMKAVTKAQTTGPVGISPRDQKQFANDVRDIGQILRCLLGEPDTQPESLVQRCVTDDLKQFREDFGEQVIVPKREVEGLLEFAIRPGYRINRGGSGIVFQVGNPLLKTLQYALKIDRPSLFTENEPSEEASRQRHAEFLRHGSLSHENIARVYGPGSLHVAETTRETRFTKTKALDAILMEWIEEATPFNRYVLKGQADSASGSKRLAPRELVRLVIQSFEALSHLHLNKLIHWDLKSDNFLVNRAGVVKLVDVGNARRLDDPEQDLTAHSTRGHLPEELEKVVRREIARQEPSSPQLTARTRVPLPDTSWDCPWLDMWMWARELAELLEPIRAPIAHFSPTTTAQTRQLGRQGKWSDYRAAFQENTFPEDDRDAQFVLQFVWWILKRLLVPELPTHPRYYDNARAVVDDLNKLEPEFGAAQAVHELWAVPQRIIRMPVSGSGVYNSRIAGVFNSTPFGRLRGHLQLGTIWHAYPGATHRRSEHAMGVLATTCEYIRALYSDQTNPFWRITINETDIKGLLLASLIHDVGHLALGHYLEELGGLFRGRTHEDYVLALLDPEYGKRRDYLRFDESDLAAIKEDRETLLQVIRSHWVSDGETAEGLMHHAANILDPRRWNLNADRDPPSLEAVRRHTQSIKMDILHSILDSAIDADKLDYLLRDAVHCGVEYPKGIDLERFFQALTTFPEMSNEDTLFESAPHNTGHDERHSTRRACIGVTDKGLLSVESILIARYQMFRSVYWHHTARAETAMLHFAATEYVGYRKEGFGQRFGLLLKNFREGDDQTALNWLKSEVEKLEKKGSAIKLAEQACAGLLGDRRHLYHEVFCLRYERSDSLDEVQREDADEVYKSFEEKSKKLDQITDPFRYVREVRALRKDICSKISETLGNKVKFDDGDVLVDIPPAGKDQVENIFVNRNGDIHPIQELSPLANAVRRSFRAWARDFRIFMSRPVLERCKEMKVETKMLERVCWDVVRGLVPQLELNLSSLGS